MSKRQLFLMSSSRVHGHGYLEHSKDDLLDFLRRNNVTKVLFVPYALADHDKYTATVEAPLSKWGLDVEGIHSAADPIDAIKNAQCLFIGGGNTFRLLDTLYNKNLFDVIRTRVMDDGMPYIGSSAGTNVATISIKTTNDMPIVYPPTFNALALVPFNINPHYLDPLPNNEHQGETREQRINEFHEENSHPVLGLREGTVLHVEGDKAKLLGSKKARLFNPGLEPMEFEPGTDLSFLLQNY